MGGPGRPGRGARVSRSWTPPRWRSCANSSPTPGSRSGTRRSAAWSWSRCDHPARPASPPASTSHPRGLPRAAVTRRGPTVASSPRPWPGSPGGPACARRCCSWSGAGPRAPYRPSAVPRPPWSASCVRGCVPPASQSPGWHSSAWPAPRGRGGCGPSTAPIRPAALRAASRWATSGPPGRPRGWSSRAACSPRTRPISSPTCGRARGPSPSCGPSRPPNRRCWASSGGGPCTGAGPRPRAALVLRARVRRLPTRHPQRSRGWYRRCATRACATRSS